MDNNGFDRVDAVKTELNAKTSANNGGTAPNTPNVQGAWTVFDPRNMQGYSSPQAGYNYAQRPPYPPHNAQVPPAQAYYGAYPKNIGVPYGGYDPRMNNPMPTYAPQAPTYVPQAPMPPMQPMPQMPISQPVYPPQPMRMPAPAYKDMPQEKVKADGMAFSVLSLISGLIGFLMIFGGIMIMWLSLIGIACGALAIVLGVLGRKRSRASTGHSSGLATAGMILGIVSVSFCALMFACTLACNRMTDSFMEIVYMDEEIEY